MLLFPSHDPQSLNTSGALRNKPAANCFLAALCFLNALIISLTCCASFWERGVISKAKVKPSLNLTPLKISSIFELTATPATLPTTSLVLSCPPKRTFTDFAIAVPAIAFWVVPVWDALIATSIPPVTLFF